jgi:para-nitrobenzyl esterase
MRALLLLAAAAAARGARPSTPHPALLAAARAAAGAARARVLASAPLTVATPYGPITGVTDGRVSQFLGVPFAAPAAGARRWAAPAPPAPWQAPRNASWWGPACPQILLNEYWGLFGAGISEDCLQLNVYAPAGAPPPGGWPIAVFIYGGSFEMGTAGFPVYDAYWLVNNTQNVMFVTINYRVSTMGWLASPLLAAEGDGSNGNYGIQDARAALEFIATAGAAFGGNPRAVTVMGESAGAGIVSHLLVSPRAAGLFRAAVIESGPFTHWITSDYNASAARFPKLAAALACPADGAAALSCMRGKSWEEVMAAGQTAGTDGGTPVVDGVEVLGLPRARAAAGAIAPGVAVLLGSNFDEGSFGVANVTEAEFVAQVRASYGAFADGVLAAYPVANFASPRAALVRVNGDCSMTCPTRDSARWLASAARAGGPAPTFVYLYAHANAAVNALIPGLGVAHATELLNVFDIEGMLLAPGERALARAWGKWWMDFAAAGDPNDGGSAAWAPWTAGAESTAVIDTGAGGPSIANVVNVRGAECDYWAANPGAYLMC